MSGVKAKIKRVSLPTYRRQNQEYSEFRVSRGKLSVLKGQSFSSHFLTGHGVKAQKKNANLNALFNFRPYPGKKIVTVLCYKRIGVKTQIINFWGFM